MVSLASRGSGIRSSRRLSSTSLWTYSARIILNTLRRDKTNTARDALQGARRPSSRTPESKKTLVRVDGLPLAIQALETTPAYWRQIFQSLPHGHSSARQCVLNAFAKTIERHVKGHNHECLAKLHKQDLTPLGKFVQFAVTGGNSNPAVSSDPDRFNRTSSLRWHKLTLSFVKVAKLKLTRAPGSCKWFSLSLTIPPNVLVRANKVIR